MPDSGLPQETRDALLSAIARLPTPVFAVIGRTKLQPLNQSASELAEFEQMPLELAAAPDAHPLGRVIEAALLRRTGDAAENRSIVAFPSGRRYVVDISVKSDKGSERWLLLLIHPRAGGDLAAAIRKFQFTPREAELAAKLAEGRTSEELCEEFGIARSTLKTHISTILAKTGCQNRTQLVAVLMNPGITPRD